MNRQLLPLAAIIGPDTVTCQLCGVEELGLSFLRAERPPAGVLGVAQVVGLEACRSCLDEAAQAFVTAVVVQPPPPKRARREPVASGGPSGRKPRPRKGGRTR